MKNPFDVTRNLLYAVDVHFSDGSIKSTRDLEPGLSVYGDGYLSIIRAAEYITAVDAYVERAINEGADLSVTKIELDVIHRRSTVLQDTHAHYGEANYTLEDEPEIFTPAEAMKMLEEEAALTGKSLEQVLTEYLTDLPDNLDDSHENGGGVSEISDEDMARLFGGWEKLN